MKPITLEGEVLKGAFGEGSKSEHQAIYLVIDEDTRYKLRRKGGNPFQDDVLEALEGRYISASGIIHNNHFIIESYLERKQDQ